MKRLLFFSVLLAGTFFTLNAQDICPENQLVTIPDTQDTVTVALLAMGSSDCPADSTLFLVSGATYTSGTFTASDVLLNAGIHEVEYYTCANTEKKVLNEPDLLPDGNGVEYAIPFVISDYPEGSTVAEAGGAILICATMEHSYLGDLDLWVTCPDGTRWALHYFDRTDNITRQLLGEGDMNTTTADPAYQYCWRVDAPRTFKEYVNQTNLAVDESLPAGDYAPEDPLSVIADCVINGEWSLRVRDNFPVDNGSVAAWSVAFEGMESFKCSYTIEVEQKSVGTNDYDRLPGLDLTVTPNPFDKELTLHTQALSAATAKLEVYAVSGQVMLRQNIALPQGDHQVRFDAEHWPAGIYFLRVRTGEGEIFRRVLRR
jgi:subtilisin-like proprotein convertase family protein